MLTVDRTIDLMRLCERKVIGAFGNEPNEDNYAIENLDILQRQVVNAVDSFLAQGEEYYDDVPEVVQYNQDGDEGNDHSETVETNANRNSGNRTTSGHD